MNKFEGSGLIRRSMDGFCVALFTAAIVSLILLSAVQAEAKEPSSRGIPTIPAPNGAGWQTIVSEKAKGPKGGFVATQANVQVLDPPERTRVKVTTKPTKMEFYGGSTVYSAPDWFISCRQQREDEKAYTRSGNLGGVDHRARAPLKQRMKMSKQVQRPELCRYGAAASLPKGGGRIKVTIQVKK